MKTAIVYATKSGAARAGAEAIARGLEDATVMDLAQATPDLDDYECIVVGSGVRIGKAYKPMRKFIESNTDLLLSKKTAFFFCNGEPATYEQMLEKNLPSDLRERAIAVSSFGGKPPFSSDQSLGWMDQDAVDALVEALLSATKS